MISGRGVYYFWETKLMNLADSKSFQHTEEAAVHVSLKPKNLSSGSGFSRKSGWFETEKSLLLQFIFAGESQ